MYRVGLGYDIHRLVRGRKLVLSGIAIPYNKGLLGHSDADVVIHSVIDAILGAMGKGDIGEHFPDTNPKFKGISSVILLKETLKLLKKEKFKIENIDINVILSAPKLKDIKIKMRNKLASLSGVNANLVNIKAKTNNKLGQIGKGKAICAQAVVLIKKK